MSLFSLTNHKSSFYEVRIFYSKGYSRREQILLRNFFPRQYLVSTILTLTLLRSELLHGTNIQTSDIWFSSNQADFERLKLLVGMVKVFQGQTVWGLIVSGEFSFGGLIVSGRILFLGASVLGGFLTGGLWFGGFCQGLFAGAFDLIPFIQPAALHCIHM